MSSATQLTRRGFLAAGAGAAVAVVAFGVHEKRELLLSPQRTTLATGERLALGVLDLAGAAAYSIETGVLGHSVIGHPTRRALAVLLAQRPGTRSCEVDLLERRLVRTFDSAPGRHFYGHGSYSADGRHLFTTENRFDDGAGVIAVRDAATLQLIGELPSHGIGPHECHLIDDGKAFIIANGGVRTHPDYAEADADPKEMSPSLTLVEVASGRLLEEVRLDDKLLSMRHLAVASAGDLAVGIEAYRGGGGPELPAVCLRSRGGPLVPMSEPGSVVQRMMSHGLSVCLDRRSFTVGVTSPAGNLVTFWSLREQRLLRSHDVHEPEGIELAGASFVVSTRSGALRFFRADDLTSEPTPAWAAGPNWKHLTSHTV